MISKQEYRKRQAIPHSAIIGSDPDRCVWCSLPEDAPVHVIREEEKEEEARVIEERPFEYDDLPLAATVIPTHQIVRAYLMSRRMTIYSKSYYLHETGSLESAVEWLTKEVDRVNAIRNMVMGSSSTIEEVIERARRMEA